MDVGSLSSTIMNWASVGVVTGGLFGWYVLANLPRLAERVNVKLSADWSKRIEKACYETGFGAVVIVAIASGFAVVGL